jgi:putative transposase
VRGVVPSAPDQIWVANITHVHLARAFAYLAVILDAFSRKAVGWAFEDSCHLKISRCTLPVPLTRFQRAFGGEYETRSGNE